MRNATFPGTSGSFEAFLRELNDGRSTDRLQLQISLRLKAKCLAMISFDSKITMDCVCFFPVDEVLFDATGVK